MATRKKRRTGKGQRRTSPAGWFIGGIVLGLIAAVVLYTRGFIPAGPDRQEDLPRPQEQQDAELLGEERPADQRYDFFTVLPEMEVVVPERELTVKAQPEPGVPESSATEEAFVLQVGSFRSAADADQMKARLALLGSVANVQTVNVDGQTWHRVRLGPVQGARSADQLRRQLQDNGIDVLVLKASN